MRSRHLYAGILSLIAHAIIERINCSALAAFVATFPAQARRFKLGILADSRLFGQHEGGTWNCRIFSQGATLCRPCPDADVMGHEIQTE
jgi:hypothetical protein